MALDRTPEFLYSISTETWARDETTHRCERRPPVLVLTRKVGERIMIGDGIVVTVVKLQGDTVRLGIAAPANVPVHREEVARRLRESSDIKPTTTGPCSLLTTDGPEVR
jgi:carbon storage regulator